MPTVKILGGKVVTKDGKVSCTCCETPPPTDCCLYPAAGLYVSFTEADLPDALIYSWRVEDSGPFTTVTLTRTGSEYFSGPTRFIYWADDENVGVPNWFHDTPVNPNSYPCLIVPSSGLDILEDDFPDTFTVFPGETWGTDPFSITRQDLCCWSGTGEYPNEFGPPETLPYDFRVCFVHLDAGGPDEYIGWAGKINDNSEWYVKQGPQSSPLGKYSTTAWPDAPDFSGTVFQVS